MLKVVDLFCGIGGFSDGFINNNFDVLGIDIWDICLKSHGGNVLQADITTLTKESLPKEYQTPDIVIGSPPCQTFSTANRDTRTKDDTLIKHFMRLVECLKPKFFVWENVVGSKCIKVGEVLDAQYFGLPQRRKRNFVANFDLSIEIVKKYYKTKKTIRDTITCNGCGVLDGYNSTIYSLDNVSPTIRRIPLKWYDGRWGNHIPKLIRFTGFQQLSIEDHLTLMGFDKNIKLFGNKTEKMIQIGNCVSPVVSNVIAKIIKSKYYENSNI